jgi:hypothetical protein
MLSYHEYIYLIHIIFIAPLFIYVGYMKNKTNITLFNVMLILGVVTFLYHLHKLYKSLSYKQTTH